MKKNIVKVAEYLKQGATIVNQQHKKALRVYLMYGKWLNFAFLLFEREKFGKRIACTWDEWLQSLGIKISLSYARKLRKIADIIGEYSRFNYLSLPFSEVYQIRNQIANMLELHEDIAKQWS